LLASLLLSPGIFTVTLSISFCVSLPCKFSLPLQLSKVYFWWLDWVGWLREKGLLIATCHVFVWFVRMLIISSCGRNLHGITPNSVLTRRRSWSTYLSCMSYTSARLVRARMLTLSFDISIQTEDISPSGYYLATNVSTQLSRPRISS